MTEDQKGDVALIKKGIKDLKLFFVRIEKQLDSKDIAMVGAAVYKADFMLTNISKILEAYHMQTPIKAFGQEVEGSEKAI